MDNFNETFAHLNNISSKSVENIEQRLLSSLVVNKLYIIKKISVFNTRFGKSALIYLFDSNANTTFKSFLPKRVVECLTTDILDKINLSHNEYTLTYLGQSSHFFDGAKTRPLVRFDCIKIDI